MKNVTEKKLNSIIKESIKNVINEGIVEEKSTIELIKDLNQIAKKTFNNINNYENTKNALRCLTGVVMGYCEKLMRSITKDDSWQQLRKN